MEKSDLSDSFKSRPAYSVLFDTFGNLRQDVAVLVYKHLFYDATQSMDNFDSFFLELLLKNTEQIFAYIESRGRSQPPCKAYVEAFAPVLDLQSIDLKITQTLEELFTKTWLPKGEQEELAIRQWARAVQLSNAKASDLQMYGLDDVNVLAYVQTFQ